MKSFDYLGNLLSSEEESLYTIDKIADKICFVTRKQTYFSVKPQYSLNNEFLCFFTLGRFFVANKKEFLLTIECKNNDFFPFGNVCNNGSFIYTPTAHSIAIRNLSGQKIFETTSECFIYSLGISPNGLYGAYQNCNSTHSEDGTHTIVIDIWKQKILLNFLAHQAAYHTEKYVFDENAHAVTLCNPINDSFAKYKLDGTLIEAFEPDRFDTKEGYELYFDVINGLEGVMGPLKNCIVEHPNDLTVEFVNKMIIYLDEALKRGLEESKLATTYRLKGELLEKLGDLSNALVAYKEAIKVNPKIGLKKTIARLEKGLLEGL